MFCSRCGSALFSEAKFCHVCGVTSESPDEDLVSNIKQEGSTKKRSNINSSSTSGQSAVTPVSFDEYRERKEKERSSRFKPKAKKARTENNDKRPSEVKINIGLQKFRDDDLKFVRGSTLPLKVNPTIGADELRKKGAEKIIKFNNDLTGGPFGFTLLYPDRTEVKTLPGSKEPFTLQRYREEIGKAYGRLTFYVCKTDEFLDFLCRSYCSDESDTTDFPTIEQVCIL